MAGANEFVIPRGRGRIPVLGLQPGWPAPDSCRCRSGVRVERPQRAARGRTPRRSWTTCGLQARPSSRSNRSPSAGKPHNRRLVRAGSRP